jgi:hypothetical protein
MVHVSPSGEVMTRLPVPDDATATNTPAPNATPFQVRVGVTWLLQRMPSDDVVTWLPVLFDPTPTNRPLP